MKEIIKKVLLGILAAVVVLGVVGYWLFTRNPNKPNTGETKPVVTDVEGSTYYAVSDPDTGEEYVVVTDIDGNRYKAEFDGQVVGTTGEQINDQVAAEEIPSNYSGEQIDVSASGNYQGQVNSVPSESVQTSSQQNTPSQNTQQAATSGNQNSQGNSGNTSNENSNANGGEAESYKFLKYQEIFASGNYLMEIVDDEMGTVTMAMKGGNMFVKADMEGFGSISLVYQKSSNKWYMLIDTLKKYSEVPKDMIGDLDPSEFSGGFSVNDNPGNVEVGAAEIDGQLLTCETITNDDGKVTKYYFDGDVLVRQDSITAEGTSSTYFSRITTAVPDSTFEVPSNYGYWNLAWLMEKMADA